MKKELDEALCRDFPLLYRDRYASMRTTCMCWGFPGDGWEPLLRQLSEKLESQIKKFLAENPNVDCECGCPKDEHVFLGDNSFCDKVFEIPYRWGPVWRSGGGWLASPQTLKDKVITLRKKAYYYILQKNFWWVQNKVNSVLEYLGKLGFHKKVPCECGRYYPNHPHASQVKEKFGTLRFYMTSETEEMSQAIREAEDKSEVTCEVCGNNGKLRGRESGRYWILTLCDKCNEDEDGVRNRG